MQSSLLQQGAELMVFGMGTVFLFLACLVLVTALMSTLVQYFTPPKQQQPASHAAIEVKQDEQLIAVITAAVHKYRSRRKP